MDEVDLFDVIEYLENASPESLVKNYHSDCLEAEITVMNVEHLSIYKFLVTVKPFKTTVAKTIYATDASRLIKILDKIINKYS